MEHIYLQLNKNSSLAIMIKLFQVIAPRRYGCNLKSSFSSVWCEIAFRWISQDLTYVIHQHRFR